LKILCPRAPVAGAYTTVSADNGLGKTNYSWYQVTVGFMVYAGTAVSHGAGALLEMAFFGVLVLAAGFGCACT